MIGKKISYSDEIIIRYLFNEMSAEAEARFEEAYLRDGNLFEQVHALEEELIEDYVKGDLSDHDRQRFERHYLASEQSRARIEFARQLVQMGSLSSLAESASDDTLDRKVFATRSRLPWLIKQPLALGFGIAAILLLLLGVGLVIELLRLHGRLVAAGEVRAAFEQQAEESKRQLTHEREQLTEERRQSIALREKLGNLSNQLDRLEQQRVKSQPLKNQIVSLILPADLRGKGQLDKTVISDHTSFEELRKNLTGQAETNLHPHRVILRIVERDREIWIQEGGKSQQ